VSCGVAKCSKKAFDEIEKAILFGDFGSVRGPERTWGFTPPRPAPTMILKTTIRCICPVRR
jgi:hypothetical protein